VQRCIHGGGTKNPTRYKISKAKKLRINPENPKNPKKKSLSKKARFLGNP